MDYIEIFNEQGELVAAGEDRADTIVVAHATKHKFLVGQGTRVDGTQYGFIVTNAPPALGA